MKEAIVLAGGLGTRLRSVTGAELPKPMAPVAGKPFLHYVLRQLCRWKVQRAVLSVGFLHQAIADRFKDHYLDLDIAYSIEHEPLGTGGAIRSSLQHIEGNACFVLNGDSFFDTDFDALEAFQLEQQADLVMALKPMAQTDRYGTVELAHDNRITRFNEKQYMEAGLINAGVYCTTRALLDKLPDREKFSFEEDYLRPFAHRDRLFGLAADGYFIDIGVPADYEKANADFVS